MFNIYLGEMFLVQNNEVTKVELYRDDKTLKKGRGYLLEDYVYIYRGTLKENPLCGIYIEDGKRVFIEPTAKEDKIIYHRDNVSDFNVDRIYREIHSNKDSFLSEKELEIINSSTETFTATLKPGDDFLKEAIKEAINKKKINLKVYKDKFKNEHSLNNMKSALNKKSKMSVSYFMDWCEILGLDWTIIITDNGKDRISPMGDTIRISSK